MTRETVNRICAGFPGAEQSDPWGGGHDAWKVGGKMFACVGTVGDGVSVKTSGIEMAAVLIETGAALKAPYFHRSWVMLPFDTADEDLLHDRLKASYTLIRDKLPKKVQATLGDL